MTSRILKEVSFDMQSKTARFTLRIQSEQLRKFQVIADYNGRSSNRELEILIRRYIEYFEKIHGTIDLDDF